MHENREISCTSWSKDQDRSAKAINRTADVNVQEKSDCAVVPVNQPNNEGQPSTEAGEGRAQTKENIVQTHIAPDPERETHAPGIVRGAGPGISILMSASPPLILSKSRMRRRARTDLSGGRSVMVVPTATVTLRDPKAHPFGTNQANVSQLSGTLRQITFRRSQETSRQRCMVTAYRYGSAPCNSF